MEVMDPCMEMLGRGQYLTQRKKNRRIRTHSSRASWSLHQFASYLEIHPCNQ